VLWFISVERNIKGREGIVYGMDLVWFDGGIRSLNRLSNGECISALLWRGRYRASRLRISSCLFEHEVFRDPAMARG
jgi:hypothetical protein